MATIYDVAAEAEVSVATVTRVVNKRGNVKAETLERVEAAIAKLGYRRSHHAVSLAHSGKKTLGVILPPSDESIRDLRILGAERSQAELERRGLTIRFYYCNSNHGGDTRLTEECIRQIQDDQPDGLVLLPGLQLVADPYIRQLPAKTRLVSLNKHVNGEGVVGFVTTDDVKCGALCTSFFAAQSADQAVLVMPPTRRSPNILDRINGFVDAMAALPHGPTILQPEWAGDEPHADLIARCLADEPAICGVYVPSLEGARVAQALVEQGGGEIIVVAFDLTKENAACVRTGAINCLIHIQHELFIYEGLRLLSDIVQFNEFSTIPEVKLPPIVLTKDLIDDHCHYLQTLFGAAEDMF